MKPIELLLLIWGVSLASSWWLYRGVILKRVDRLVVAAASVAGVVAAILGLVL